MKKEIITPIDTPEAFLEEAESERQRKGKERHPPLLRALGLAYYWQSLIEAGRCDSFSAIAAAEGVSDGQVSRIMHLLRLSPERVLKIVKAPRSYQLEQVMQQDIPLCWERHRGGSESCYSCHLSILPLVIKVDLLHCSHLSNLGLRDQIAQEGRAFSSPNVFQ